MASTRYLCIVNRRTYQIARKGSSMLTQKAGVEVLQAVHRRRYLGDAALGGCYEAQLIAGSEVTAP